jgi:hypothetical protein
VRTLYIGAVAGANFGIVQSCISACKITAQGGNTNKKAESGKGMEGKQ